MATEIQAIFNVAQKEIGYLEKKTNAYLDHKTKNAGYNNYTKYWRDIRAAGAMAQYGYSKSSNFAGGKNWPYCAAGVFWAFMKALGIDRACTLLLCTKTAAFINCDTLAGKSKSAGQLYSKPMIGDVALFYKGNHDYYHTEFVWKVEGSRFYTTGWNTSGASSVIANGGAVCSKKYDLNSTKVMFHRPKYKQAVAAVKSNPKKQVSVTLIKLGSRGEDVKGVQKKLIALGYSCGKSGADGIFGNDTKSAVIKFQKANGLVQDGIVGNNTSTKLNVRYEAWKAAQKAPKPAAKPAAPASNDPTKRKVLFVGACTGNNVNVRIWAGTTYGNIKAKPKLGKGNLVDVLDYSQKDNTGATWYYIRIKYGINKYCYGFIHSKYIRRA